MRNYFKYLVLFLVSIELNLVHAGSFDDFFSAIALDQPQGVRALLVRGFDPNTVSDKGQPALLHAIQQGSSRAAEVLVDDPRTVIEVQTPLGETALMLAALRGWSALCLKLLERDADVNRPGWTPLHYAATGGHSNIVRLLLDHHAYIDAESPNGSTPLMLAARYGNSDTVQLLLEAGADPSLKNSLGLSAIDFALAVSNQSSANRIAAAIRARRPKGVW